MNTLSRAISATAGILLCTAVFFSSSLFAASTPTTGDMPMAHNHGAMMADAAATDTNSYHSTGQIKAWNAASVSIAHRAISALNWPPMTMTFDLPDNLIAAPLPVGAPVAFSFRQTEQGYQLTAISAQQP
ncbi:copper-binding protein [Yersinia rohdei]|uniref:copper-binding protein n=1 Tax=Yersinia rohdei TaxID=29485 RepID=UPI0005E93887|nr:copper-binding protein [Yersinia rohdei]MDN0094876.1 copper-binding protein [Yersinia rohdei]CQJ54821.1 putative efflux system protein [Yersinia rohdei]